MTKIGTIRSRTQVFRMDIYWMSRQPVRQRTKQEREQRRRGKELQRTGRTKLLKTLGIILGGILVVAGFVYVTMQNQTTFDTTVNPAYPTIDKISCDQGEHGNVHIHAHLSIYIDGKARAIPATIGIASDQSCIYWLHTHDTSGILHIEAPKNRTFTLSNFLDIWEQHFSQLSYPIELSASSGWQVYVNGKPFTGNWRAMPLHAHSVITLAYNSPGVHPDTTFSWNGL